MSRGSPRQDKLQSGSGGPFTVQREPPLQVVVLSQPSGSSSLGVRRNGAQFPPLQLIHPLLEQVKQEDLSLILVAPESRLVLWFP